MDTREILTGRIKSLAERLNGALDEMKARGREIAELEGRIDECRILLASLPKPAETTPASETAPAGCQAGGA